MIRKILKSEKVEEYKWPVIPIHEEFTEDKQELSGPEPNTNITSTTRMYLVSTYTHGCGQLGNQARAAAYMKQQFHLSLTFTTQDVLEKLSNNNSSRIWSVTSYSLW